MRIVIRTDSGRNIGTGHIMRCLTLAQAMQGSEITFITTLFGTPVYNDGVLSTIISAGHGVYPIHKSANFDRLIYQNFGEYDHQHDAQCTAEFVRSIGGCDILIVDHYCLDYYWESSVKAACSVGILMVIDDMHNRVHDCSVLLDHNLHNGTNPYQNLAKGACVLLGPQYLLLNSKFNAQKVHTGTVSRIHICMGGSDQANLTQRIVSCILKHDLGTMEYDVVLGSLYTHRPAIEQLVGDRATWTIYQNIDNMHELLLRADLCIGASGTSAYERCYVGVPTITITFADNQIEVAEKLHTAGAITYLNRIGTWTESTLMRSILYYTRHPRYTIEQSLLCKKLVDGKGPARIHRALSPFVVVN